MKKPKFSKRHYKIIADSINSSKKWVQDNKIPNGLNIINIVKEKLIQEFIEDNNNFSVVKFEKACNEDIIE